MASRGLWHFMGARTRRSLALSWSALFVLSLLLQYFSFALASPIKAAVGSNLFELDGNAVDDSGAALPDDWDKVNAGTSGATSTVFKTDGFGAGDDIFTGGSTKDGINLSSWLWKVGSVQDKDDIENAFAAAYTSGSDTFAYFGLDRYQTSGDATAGFWFFKNAIAKTGAGSGNGSSFSGVHAEGDILVVLDFSNGGATASAVVYTWHNGALTATGQTGTKCDGSVQTVCAISNVADAASPWAYTPKAGTANVFPGNALFEGGINLTALGLDTGCFSSFMAETRSSNTTSSTLSDFSLGSFSFCTGADIESQVKQNGQSTGDNGHITIGQSVADTATVTGTKGTATGTIDFFQCFSANSTPDCTSGGTKVGGTKTLASGAATSDSFTPTAVGEYCFRVEYTPAAGSKYLAGTHTNTTSECFVVDKKPTSITTAANQTVTLGQAIADSATLAGATADAGGSIVFRAYGPADGNCSNAVAFSSSPVAVSGNGTYGPVSFTPTTAGNYRWIATYSGDAKNVGSAGACNDAGELDTVGKVTPAISTQASAAVLVGGQLTDTATVTGGASPTGTVSFALYGPNDATCANPPIFTSADRPLSGGTATSAAFTTVDVGTYRWIATYNGDVNNNVIAGACNDTGENVVVSPKSPTLTTQLHGDGKVGASITVPLGTAVFDTANLAGATANATGTVHYQVFSDAQCRNKIADGGTIALVNGVAQNSSSVTFNSAGNFYWQADYSGDANNNPASSACNLEIVTVQPNAPAITTTASGTVPVGGQISDSANLTGGFNPTGTITFKLYGPNDQTCSGAVAFSATVPVSANGQYQSGNFTTTTAGTYRWIANYSGDANNAAASGACNDALENVIVTKKSPTVVTVASASVEVGGQIHDTATLAGGYNPTGSITFNLYGPNDATCTGAVAFTDTAIVSGNTDYVSANFTTLAAGTYRWIANYSGDANNNATANGCNGTNENVIVTKKSPTVVTVASASVEVGGQIHDTATLAGGYNPTGSITFNLYGPNDATCTGAVAFTDTAIVSGNTDYVSANFTTLAAGTYRWIANYSGDANNNATANGCNGTNENVIVTKKSPTISTLATAGAQVGDKIHDVATVSGGFSPTGTVIFKLFGPTDGNCDGTAIFSSTVALGQNGTATSGDYTVTEQGTFHWVAAYSGDANNDPATGACGDQGETTIVNQFSPDITTALHSGDLSGAKITVLFGSSATDQAVLTGASATAGGTVTYTVYSDANCTVKFADAGAKTVTNGIVPPSNAVVFPDAGTYYWQASYGGDAANAPALSVCTDEVLTVTTPNLHAVKLVKTNAGAFGPTSSANPGDTLTFQITVTNSGNADATNVPVSDDIAAVLAHSTYNGDCNFGCSLVGSTLKWTIPTIAKNGGSVVLTFSVTLDATFPAGTTHLPNVVVVTGPGSNCAADGGDADCDTDTTVVAQPDLNVTKLVATNDGAFGPTSVANPGDVLNYQITISNTGNADATNVPVSDDIAAILAHATYNADCSNGCSFAADTLTWTIPTIAAGDSVTLTFSVTLDGTFPTGTTHLPNVVVVTGPGSNCGAESQDADCDTDTTVATSSLSIAKAFTGNTAGTDPDLGVPAAKIGDTLHYTLTYHGEGLLTNAVITDILPNGLAYVAGSAAGDAHFTFDSYDSATRTLKWVAADLLNPAQAETNSVDGAVTYDVKVLVTAPDLAQPLINTATIDSDQTEPDSATAAVAVLAPPLELTPPPTSTLTPQNGTSNPGFALMLILLGVAGLTLGIGFITPAPARVRRRDRLG